MTQPITRVWTFLSDSNPDTEYQTLKYADGSTSCQCKGWTRRVAPDGSRSCKHTRWVDLGTADQHCTATHNYQTETHQPQQKPQHQHQQHNNHHAHQIQPQIKTTPRLGQRKFAV